MRIFVIGSGKMANALVPALQRAGHQITGIHSRNDKTGKSLAKHVGCDFQTTIHIPTNTELVLLAVNDDATKTVANDLKRTKAVVAHTSGSVGIGALGRKKAAGVFYPMETMSGKRNVAFNRIPIIVEGSDEKSLTLLLKLAYSLSKEVYVLDEAKRKALHVAAVFTNNFTNHLLGVASDITQKAGIPFPILEKLATTTLKNAFNHTPQAVQTGPAKRGDKKTIDQHLAFLKSTPEFRKIYEVLSRQIAAVHNSKKPKDRR